MASDTPPSNDPSSDTPLSNDPSSNDPPFNDPPFDNPASDHRSSPDSYFAAPSTAAAQPLFGPPSADADDADAQISIFRWLLLASAIAFALGGFPLGSSVLTAVLAARPALETAQWILRKDPHPLRGKVCALFHVSVGIWHGFPAALITLGGFVFAAKHLGMPFPLQDLQATMMGLIAAVGVSALAGGLATFAALRTGLRVWAHPRFETALERELQTGTNLYTNHAVFVLATSLTIPALIAIPLILMTPKPPIVWILVLPVSILSVVIPCLVIGNRIFADSPRAYFVGADTTDEKSTAE